MSATEIQNPLTTRSDPSPAQGEDSPSKRAVAAAARTDQALGQSRTTSGPATSPDEPSLGAYPREDELSEANTIISDERFIKDLERLKELRSFLIQEAVTVHPSESLAMEFGRLNLLRYRYVNGRLLGRGRDPTEEEWNRLERHTRILFGLLTPSLRRRFILGAVPSMLAYLPILFASVALASLILAIMAYNTDLLRMHSLGANVLPFYLIWLMSLGAIGAIAFIGMNALSVQEDITFDLTNMRLIVMRIALGALFGLVLTLPFGFQGFLEFCRSIANGAPAIADNASPQTPTVTVQAAMLVLPFILGFSTSLVILILNRFVDAVQGFFGRHSSRDDAMPVPASTASAAISSSGSAFSVS